MVLTGEHVDATTVAGWGMVNLALQRAKPSLLASDDETLSDGIATELDHFVASVGTETRAGRARILGDDHRGGWRRRQRR